MRCRSQFVELRDEQVMLVVSRQPRSQGILSPYPTGSESLPSLAPSRVDMALNTGIAPSLNAGSR